MPRKARLKSSSGIYHVMMRGINRQMIFDDHYDHIAFLKILDRVVHPIDLSGMPKDPICEVYAYALMGNHFHILLKMLEVPDAPSPDNRFPDVGVVVKKLAAAYVLYYNNRHGRDGHLFKERFKSEPCESADYFKTLMAYIHQNPVKAGLSRTVAQYRYTSWHEYLGDDRDHMSICNTAEAMRIVPFDKLKEAVETPLDASAKCIENDEKIIRRKLPDSQIVEHMAQCYGLEHPDKVQGLPIKERNAVLSDLLKMGAGVRQLQRITGVGLYVISRLNSRLQ